jgi:hypothetical protein
MRWKCLNLYAIEFFHCVLCIKEYLIWLKVALFALMMIVAAVQVFEPRPIAMFLSLSRGCHYKPYYETHEFLLSSVLFYYSVFLVVRLMVVLLSVMMMMMMLMMIHSFIQVR